MITRVLCSRVPSHHMTMDDDDDDDDDDVDDQNDSFGEDDMMVGGVHDDVTSQLAAAGWRHGVHRFVFVLYIKFTKRSVSL